jgi:hypothetical protein
MLAEVIKMMSGIEKGENSKKWMKESNSILLFCLLSIEKNVRCSL